RIYLRWPKFNRTNDYAIGQTVFDLPYRFNPVVLIQRGEKTSIKITGIEGKSGRPIDIFIKPLELGHGPLAAPQARKYTFVHEERLVPVAGNRLIKGLLAFLKLRPSPLVVMTVPITNYHIEQARLAHLLLVDNVVVVFLKFFDQSFGADDGFGRSQGWWVRPAFIGALLKQRRQVGTGLSVDPEPRVVGDVHQFRIGVINAHGVRHRRDDQRRIRVRRRNLVFNQVLRERL